MWKVLHREQRYLGAPDELGWGRGVNKVRHRPVIVPFFPPGSFFCQMWKQNKRYTRRNVPFLWFVFICLFYPSKKTPAGGKLTRGFLKNKKWPLAG